MSIIYCLSHDPFLGQNGLEIIGCSKFERPLFPTKNSLIYLKRNLKPIEILSSLLTYLIADSSNGNYKFYC